MVIDKAAFPRDKICGDGLTTSALRELADLGVSPTRVDGWFDVDDILIRSPGGHELVTGFPRGRGTYSAIAPRRALDAALVAQARWHGADVEEGVELVGLAPLTAGGVRVETRVGTTSHTRHVDAVVAADGMWSPSRRLCGTRLEGYRGDWHAFRQYFTDVTGPASRRLIVSFEPDLLPGYFWAFPLAGGRANVGFGIQRGEGLTVRDMKWLWPDLLSRPHLRSILGDSAAPAEPHRAWPIPSQFEHLTPADRGVLWVGDAAGVCDPMTGEGIGQALITGRLAAAALLSASASGKVSSADAIYSASLRARFAADHRMSRLLIRALRHRKGARAAIRLAGASNWTRQNFARWLFEDYARGIALRPSTWRRGVLDGDGATFEPPIHHVDDDVNAPSGIEAAGQPR